MSSFKTSRNLTPLSTILNAFNIIWSITSLIMSTSDWDSPARKEKSCSFFAVFTSDDRSDKSNLRYRLRISLL